MNAVMGGQRTVSVASLRQEEASGSDSVQVPLERAGLCSGMPSLSSLSAL